MSGKSIANDMQQLREALSAVVKNPKDSESLAFHLGDIREELAAVADCLGRLIEGGPASRDDLALLTRCMAIHWPHHLSNIKKVLLKIEGEKDI